MSERDGRCLFDQLKAPPSIQGWFGRSAVYVRDLLETGGVDLAFLQSCFQGAVTLQPHCRVIPVSRVWPMGFSWSSYLAQSTMLQVCREGGLNDESILAEDVDVPCSTCSVHALATDDILHFTVWGVVAARGYMRKLDGGFRKVGVQRSCEKDVTGSLSGTAIRNGFHDSVSFAPSARSSLHAIQAVHWMCSHTDTVQISPLQLAALLLQWHALLNRPSLSLFHHVYSFVRSQGQEKPRPLPKCVITELVALCLLMPLLEADVRCPWADTVVPTDSAPSFGFGVAVMLWRSSCPTLWATVGCTTW